LEPVANALGKLISGVSFFGETIGPRAHEAIEKLAPGKILVLENLRRNAGEKNNSPSFAQELALLGDIFVQDSFDTCHRLHASIVSVPHLLPSFAGLLLEEEVTALTKALTPTHPSLAIIGGAKFITKEAVLTTLLTQYQNVFVGGALANDFLKAAGEPVGTSLVSGADPSEIQALLGNPKLVLPVDFVVVPSTYVGTPEGRSHMRIAQHGQVAPNESILDFGPATRLLLAKLAMDAKSILWNGPLGNYENGFTDATDALAESIAESHGNSVIGGGDTIASIERLGLLSHFSFVSTGGGAMLDFLAKGTLPGIEALST
jgi:3-phosphoglycerate kinase